MWKTEKWLENYHSSLQVRSGQTSRMDVYIGKIIFSLPTAIRGSDLFFYKMFGVR